MNTEQPRNAMISALVLRQAKRASLNFKRAKRLVTMYQRQYGNRRGKRPQETDLLRAAVVFTHASLEDFIRSLAGALLPWSEEDALSRVPLAGTQGRAEKFNLGNLVVHRGKTIQQVLEQSVSEFLERSNYNNPGEIMSVLLAMKIKLPPCDRILSDIGSMIARRHLIVHRADTIATPRIRSVKPTPLDTETVLRWIQATITFVLMVLGHLPVHRYKRSAVSQAKSSEP